MGKRVKLNVPNNVSVQWAPKGSYRLEHVLKFIQEISTQPCSFFPGNRKIFTLDDYSAHLHPEVKEALKKKGYFLVILPEGITGFASELHRYSSSIEILISRKGITTNNWEIARKPRQNSIAKQRDEIMQMLKSSWSEWHHCENWYPFCLQTNRINN